VEYTPAGMGADTPYHVECRYANGMKLMLRDSGFLGLGSCHARFEGDGGWVETADSGRIAVSDNLKGQVQDVPQAEAQQSTTNHVRDFLNCVKTRRQPRANALAACQTHMLSHAAYIAFQLGRKLTFDPATDTFTGPGSDEANRMRSRAMRDPWRI
jgi:hypothetical protein